MNVLALKDAVLSRVDVVEFYKHYFPKFHPGGRFKCIFHREDTPSLSIGAKGQFQCFGCGKKGSSVVQFYEYAEDVDLKTALTQIANKFCGAHYVPDEKVQLWHQELMKNKERLLFLETTRGAKPDLLKKLSIGWNGLQFTFPIPDATGLWVNVRKYRPGAKRKIVSYKAGYGEAMLYPISALESQTVYLCEGEPDMLCGRAHGLNTITSTGGASHWKDHWDAFFKGRDVIIVADIDARGIQWSNMVGARLLRSAHTVKVVRLPLQKGEKDLTHYLMRQGPKDLETVVKDTPVLLDAREGKKKLEGPPLHTTLGASSKAEYYFKPVQIDCVVSGKELSPYLAPKAVKINCSGGKEMCDMCHRKPKGFTDTVEFDFTSDDVLRLVDVSDHSLEHYMRVKGQIPKGCEIQVDHVAKQSVEKLNLTPSLDEGGDQSIMSTGYFVGHGIEANRTYRVTGFLLPEPTKQRAVHILTKAESVYDSLEYFKLTPEVKASLDRFRAKDPDKYLGDMYGTELPKVTKIIGRPEIHAAIDLIYHSVIGFRFNNEDTRRGWLEGLVFGDTQQGKTVVALTLGKFFKLGEIATGEAATFAGLVGGLQKANDRWVVSWGMVARHDRRLVVIDEASGLSYEDIERMSRVRSEGRAELVKVVTQVTNARCRLIWLANPRSGQVMSTYSAGIDALQELIGKAEDISRFDFVIAVAKDEVPSKVLNEARPKEVKLNWTSEEQKLLILWAWSRKPEQVKFTAGATNAILRKWAPEFSDIYSPEVPLVQKENIRIKLARVAAAVAARCFSSPDYETLEVGEAHVDYAARFLQATYDKPALGYRAFSEVATRRNTLKDDKAVEQLLKKYPDKTDDLIFGLLEQNQITVSDVADFAGIEKWEAKEWIGEMVRQRALVKTHSFYSKRPPLISLLNRLKAKSVDR